MTRINTNVQSLRGLHNVQKANEQLSTSLTRLSTGLKINAGKDDPAGLIASQALGLQITTINESIDNSNRANNVLSTADSALGEIGGLLNQIQGLVQQGLNTGALSQDEINANQSQIDAALSAINKISANTTFAGNKLIDGSKAFTTATSTTDAAKLSDYQINEAILGSTHQVQLNAQVVAAAQKAALKYSGGALASQTTLQVTGAKGSQVLFLGAGSSTQNVADAVNAVKDVTGVDATVQAASPGALTVSNATAGSAFVGNTTAGTATVATDGTIDVTRNARAGFTQFTSVEGDSLLTFTDNRATATTGDATALGGQIKVQLINTTAASANSSVSSVSVDASGDYTVQIELKDDGTAGAGHGTATLADIQSAIAANAWTNANLTVSGSGSDGFGSAVGTDTYDVAAVQQLNGGQDTANNDVTFTDARTGARNYGVAVAFIASAANQALGVNVATDTFGNKTVNVTLATDAQGNVTSTAAQVETLVNGDATASTLLTAAASGTGAGVVQASSAQQLSDVTNSQLTVTDARATDTNAVFTDQVKIQLVNGGASQTLGANFVASGDGGTVTVTLATDANGVVTSTAADIANLINNNADTNISGKFHIDFSGDGTGEVQASALTSLSAGVNGADNDLTFTDARATDTQGAFPTSISVQFLNGGANQALSVGVTQDADGNHTITVNLATDASGNVTSTAGDVANFIANDSSTGAQQAKALVNVSASGAGTGVLQAKGPEALTGGADGANDDVTFTDVRTGTQTQSINVAFADPGANNSPLSVTVGLDGNGDHLVTVNLATNAQGDITSTAADVANFIANDASAGAVAARALVSASADGNGAGVVAARSADALTATTGNDVLVLNSHDYGSHQFVQVDVLSGTFDTTLDDGTTASRRNSGVDINVTINGQTALGDGLSASLKSATVDASLTFNTANNVAGSNAIVSITGGGALFQIGQEVSAAGQIGLGIEAINTAKLGGVSGKLYELGSGNGKSLADVQAGSANASDLVDIIGQALNRVNTLRGRLGAIQKNVIETNISTLGVSLENITDAKSQITDTDFAQETAQLQRAQILSQAGLAILSIANQNPQQVLSLLR